MKISELPKEIQELVFERQIESGNPINTDLLLIHDIEDGNFNWDRSKERSPFWSTIDDGDFDVFYELYPTPEPIPALPLSTKSKLEVFISDLKTITIK